MVTYSFEVFIAGITGISKLCHCQILITPIMFLHYVTYSFEVFITGISKLCHCQILITPIMFLHVVYAPCCSVVTCTAILFRVYEKTLNRRPMLLRIVSTGILLPIFHANFKSLCSNLTTTKQIHSKAF